MEALWDWPGEGWGQTAPWEAAAKPSGRQGEGPGGGSAEGHC